MSTVPNNILQQVITYNESNLPMLLNLLCIASTSNTEFKDFDQPANLGDTLNFDKPPRYLTANSLVATFQASQQLFQPLQVDQAANVSYDFTAQQYIFNVEDYMKKFGRSAMAELANIVESNIALNANSHVPVMTITNGNSVPTGALHTESGPFRFFGDGRTAINSFQQLAQMHANFVDFGAAPSQLQVYLPNTYVPPIIGSGLNQFVPNRNDEIALSWKLGEFDNAKYYVSNLLPTHFAGTVGNLNQTLTVVSTNDPTGANITQITFSGASATDVDAIKSGDMFQFQDGVSGISNLRFLTWIGHVPSNQPVQFRATADAASNGGGQVVVNIYPPLVATANSNQNITANIIAGMQVKVLPDHKCGMLVGGKGLYVAIPKLPDQVPFPSSTQQDPESGIAVRMYYGTLIFQNQYGTAWDCIWGSTGVPEYMMRIAFPV